MKRTKTINRNFEMIMGIIGSAMGLCSGSALIFIESLGHAHTPFLGIVAIIGSILGFVSSFYVRKNENAAGVGFVIATMFVIVGADHTNILSAIFLLIAGVSTLFRN